MRIDNPSEIFLFHPKKGIGSFPIRPVFLKRADISTSILNNSTDILKYQLGSAVFFTSHIYFLSK